MNDPFVAFVLRIAIRIHVVLLVLIVLSLTLALFMRSLQFLIVQTYASLNAFLAGFSHLDIGIQCVLSLLILIGSAFGIYNQLKKLHRMKGAASYE